jgi:hypothetical protein
MASLCCKRCHEANYYKTMRGLMLREPEPPCACPCHRGERPPSPARGIAIGVLLAAVAWVALCVAGAALWRMFSG